MKYFLLISLISGTLFCQTKDVPAYYNYDETLSQQLQMIAADSGLLQDFNVGEDGTEQISLAVIDMTNGQSDFGGLLYSNFIYPASVYKMYVAAEVLRQISDGKYSLDSRVIVKPNNAVDRGKEIATDPRPLLKEGDTVSVNYLLDLMITRSDNSAANCLIDLADRKNINTLMHQYGWQGSEITRKFLKRKFEDAGYDTVRGTETCALHAADFMYLIEKKKLVNPWVSIQLKSFLSRQLDNTKYSQGLTRGAMFSHKTGWFSYWTNDVGIVEEGDIKYVIACFLPLEEEYALDKFKILSETVHNLIKKRNSK